MAGPAVEKAQRFALSRSLVLRSNVAQVVRELHEDSTYLIAVASSFSSWDSLRIKPLEV
jgi:hypothetical protein